MATSITAVTNPTTNGMVAASASTASTITSDFSTFLTLLTTQLRNQDPLNPMDSTEFATQLATFSGVEQQVRTNEHLQSILSQTGVTTLAQLGQWVGMEVLTDVPVQFDGSPVILQGLSAQGADQAFLIVRNAEGSEVQRVPVSLPVSELTWAGVSGQGSPMAKGAYQFELESLRQGSLMETTKLRHYARVAEVRPGVGGGDLHLEGGQVISANSITGLRRGSS